MNHKYLKLQIVMLMLFLIIGCSKKTDPVIVIKDKDELVSVRIQEGLAYLSFNREYWNMDLESTEYLIETKNTVKDALVATVKHENPETVFPTVVLLMEDGTVEWLLASPFEDTKFDKPTIKSKFVSFGKIPWIKDIKSLVLEDSKEGIGLPTIYAIDNKDSKYDLSTLSYLTHHFGSLFDSELALQNDFESELYTFLELEENGNVKLMRKLIDGHIQHTYKGSYSVSFDEAPKITFDLKLEDSTEQEEIPTSLKGIYWLDVKPYKHISLFLSEGDLLSDNQVEYKLFFKEAMNKSLNLFKMDEGEFIDYMVDNDGLFQDMVHKGMKAMVPKETTVLPTQETGRNIILGTDHEEHFVNEMHYTVTDEGDIYLLDVIKDEWFKVFEYKPPVIPSQ